MAIIISGGIRSNEGYSYRVNEMISALKDMDINVMKIAFVPLLDWFKILYKNNVLWKTIPLLPVFNCHILRWIRDIVAQYWLKKLIVKNDILMIQSENPEPAFLAKLCSIPFVLDLHGDSLSEENMKISKNSNKFPKWYLDIVKRNEKYSFNCCAATLVVSLKLYQEMVKRYGSRPIYKVVPSCVDTDRFLFSKSSRTEIRKSLGIREDHIVLAYFGSLGVWQMIDETLMIVSRLKNINEKIYFLMVTREDCSYLIELFNKIGVHGKDYNILSLQYNEVPKYLSAVDYGFLIRDDSLLNKVSSPTKFNEYIASGVPVISTCFSGDASDIINHHKLGYIISKFPIDVNELENLNQYIIDNYRNREKNAVRYNDICKSERSIQYLKQQVKEFYNTIIIDLSSGYK